MASVILTYRFTFSAAHRLHTDKLSDRENLELYGTCNDRHGHNYALEVSVSGEPDELTGMLISATDLTRLVEENLIRQVDHQDLNHDVAFLHGVTPTVENLVVHFWHRIHRVLPEQLGLLIELSETANIKAAYHGAHCG